MTETYEDSREFLLDGIEVVFPAIAEAFKQAARDEAWDVGYAVKDESDKVEKVNQRDIEKLRDYATGRTTQKIHSFDIVTDSHRVVVSVEERP